MPASALPSGDPSAGLRGSTRVMRETRSQSVDEKAIPVTSLRACMERLKPGAKKSRLKPARPFQGTVDRPSATLLPSLRDSRGVSGDPGPTLERVGYFLPSLRDCVDWPDNEGPCNDRRPPSDFQGRIAKVRLDQGALVVRAGP
jgi:hypothetical protein